MCSITNAYSVVVLYDADFDKTIMRLPFLEFFVISKENKERVFAF